MTVADNEPSGFESFSLKCFAESSCQKSINFFRISWSVQLGTLRKVMVNNWCEFFFFKLRFLEQNELTLFI